MGVLHNELPSSTLGRAIRAVLGVKEGEKTIERFGETLTPVLDLWGRPEFAKLRDERLCAGYVTNAAGGAGNYTEISLRNPAGTDLLGIVEQLDFYNSTATTYTYRLKIAIATDLGTPQNTTGFRDLRIAVASAAVAPRLLISSKNADAATHGFVIYQVTSPSFRHVTIPFPMVLPPNTSLIIDPSIANTPVNVALQWRERRALAGELD